jgi:hypothetical protein
MLNNARFSHHAYVVGVVFEVLIVPWFRTLLEEDYKEVLESRLKTSLPVSTVG